MKFLLPVGGIVDHRFGILTTPGHKGIPLGVVAGMEWAGDTNSYLNGFDADTFFLWLETMLPYRPHCLFIPVPDRVGDARTTIELYWQWFQRFTGWPIAFVAQDGQEDLEFPGDEWQTLFIGGTTEWKLSDAALSCIRRAQAMGKSIHIGRVNWRKRYNHFRAMEGSDGFTCDGTRTRFDGTTKAAAAWLDYMESAYQVRLPLPVGYYRRQLARSMVRPGG